MGTYAICNMTLSFLQDLLTHWKTLPSISLERDPAETAHAGEDRAREGRCEGGAQVGPDGAVRADDCSHHEDTRQVVRVGAPQGVAYLHTVMLVSCDTDMNSFQNFITLSSYAH